AAGLVEGPALVAGGARSAKGGGAGDPSGLVDGPAFVAGGARLPKAGATGDDGTPSFCAMNTLGGERDERAVVAGGARTPKGGGEGGRDGGGVSSASSRVAAGEKAKRTLSGPFSTVASRRLTVRNIHPEWLSPVRKRTTPLVASSRNRAIPSAPTTTVPISPRRKRSGCVGSVTGGAGGARSMTATGRAAGRRDGRKIGRSRVAPS